MIAVDEVGNPTILATLAVIAALLPMAFVSGLMGPYMRPIPVGASAAMLFSLLVAFIVSPWLAYNVLGRRVRPSRQNAKRTLAPSTRSSSARSGQREKEADSLSAFVGLLVLAMVLVPLKAVTVKMLPFDNKSELQVIIDMPEGTTPGGDGRAGAREMARVPEDGARGHGLPGLRRHCLALTISTAWCATTSCARGRTWRTSR